MWRELLLGTVLSYDDRFPEYSYILRLHTKRYNLYTLLKTPSLIRHKGDF